ncbi:MAG TPA: PhnD/SsuA/transferrin family substrate-binding protein [Nocardioides sp.]|nr:PhnD/SsuA/transferrin family substrate-binding protein [Nocardioides sp.]
MTSIVVGSFTPSVLLDVARETGRLAQRDLEVAEVPVTSSPAQFRSLLDGELDVGLTNPDNVLAYRFNPGNPLGRLVDARIVAAIDRGMGLGLYGRPGTSAGDLVGARVGVDVATSGFALALYALAESIGVAREDYELVALGSTPRRLEALLAGDCAATMLNAGNELIAEQHGCVRLASAAELLSPYLGTVVAVVGAAHLEVAEQLSAALLETAREIAEGRLDEETSGSAKRRLDLDDTLAMQYLARLRDPRDGLVPDGVVDRAALETLVRLRTRYLPTPGPEGGDLLDSALDEDSGLVHR